MEIVGVAAIALLALACPLSMVGMAVVPWLIARARGQKKELSMSCMPMGGHGEQQQPAAESEESSLREDVTRLQQELDRLKAATPEAFDHHTERQEAMKAAVDYRPKLREGGNHGRRHTRTTAD